MGQPRGSADRTLIPAKLQSQLDDLAMFPDRADRIDALIALSREYVHPTSEEVPRSETAKVPGCESEVYLWSDGRHFRFAVDNPQGVSAMALAAILQAGIEGASKEEILAIPDEIVYEIFGRELSMGKNLGLTNMVRMVREAAKAA